MVHVTIPWTRLSVDTCRHVRQAFLAAMAVLALALGLTYAQTPFTYGEVRVIPERISRADVIRGIDVQVCKAGTWHRLPARADAYQTFVPLDANGKRIAGLPKPAGIHHIDVPARRGGIDQCRSSLLRLDTGLGVGHWGFELELHTWPWPGIPTIQPSVSGRAGMTALARFEVVP